MNISLKTLPKSQAELQIEISVEEMQPYLAKAAQKISEQKTIPGFRPGRATIDAVKRHMGEMALWQESAEHAIQAGMREAVHKYNLETIGQPHVDIKKLAPNNSFEYTLTVHSIPEVTMPEYTTLSVERKPVVITDKEIDEALKELQRMRRTEVLAHRPAQKGDKLNIVLTVSVNDKKIEEAQKGGVVIGEERFIPGFEDELLGLKKGDTKKFELSFPQEYSDKKLAGKKAQFRVEVNDVYALTLPDITDDFAHSVAHVTTTDELRKQLKQQLEAEAHRNEEARLENNIITSITKQTEFTDIPDILVTTESKKLVQDLEQSVAQQGMTFEQYSERVGKKREDIMLDMAPRALERVKQGLVMREVVKKEGLKVARQEIDEYIVQLKEVYKEASEVQKHLDSPEYREHLAGTILSRKVFEKLKELMVHTQENAVNPKS